MRLHLDTNNATGAADTASTNSPVSATGKPAAALNTSGTGSVTSDPGSRDSVAVSNASTAWSTSFSDRAARVGQLAAAVQSGTYQVASSAVSQSIVASALA